MKKQVSLDGGEFNGSDPCEDCFCERYDEFRGFRCCMFPLFSDSREFIWNLRTGSHGREDGGRQLSVLPAWLGRSCMASFCVHFLSCPLCAGQLWCIHSPRSFTSNGVN